MSSYQIDAAHSSAQFKVRHMMIANVRGEFHKMAGTVQFDDATPGASQVEVSIDAASINTRDQQRDKDLQGENFFNVARFPTINFKSKSITASSADSFSVVGDLTIHGVTREVSLKVDELTPEAKDPWGGTRRGAQATTRINRKDFGMGFNMALEAGGFLVGEEIDIHIDVELIKQA